VQPRFLWWLSTCWAASTINNESRCISTYQDMPMESLLILDGDLGMNHRPHDNHPAERCGRFPSRSSCIRQPRLHAATQLIVSRSLLDH
jgi:hypothetical protein